MHETWTAKDGWPRDVAGYVFLARAINRLGLRRYPEDWTGNEGEMAHHQWMKSSRVHNYADPAGHQTRFSHVTNLLQAALETGVLAAWLRAPEGHTFTPVPAERWYVDKPDIYFRTCRMPSLSNRLLASDEWIFLDERQLASLIDGECGTAPAARQHSGRRQRAPSPERRAILAYVDAVCQGVFPEVSDERIAEAVREWVKKDGERRKEFNIGTLDRKTVSRARKWCADRADS